MSLKEATGKLCERAFQFFGDLRFERLIGISNGHLYNLRCTDLSAPARHTRQYPTGPGRHRRAAQAAPERAPGLLRVDLVHQGDLDDIKSLYHLNLVDEMTQFQFVGSVERISEHFLLPVLEALIERFPFTALGLHADNGSEYINQQVVRLLDKLHIAEFTKSRAGRSNDNALIESKNGAVVRKHLGHAHIPGQHAVRVNAFAQRVLSPWLNFHRPCFFPTGQVDAKGRVRKH